MIRLVRMGFYLQTFLSILPPVVTCLHRDPTLGEQFGFGVEPLPAFGREPTVSLLQGADVKATCLVSESGP